MCVDFSTTVDFSSLADIFNLAAGSKNGTCGHSEDKEDCCHCLEVSEPHRATTATPPTSKDKMPCEGVLVIAGDSWQGRLSSVEVLGFTVL